jgi:uncharacterized protein YdaU (DUF1376 family)
MNKSPAFQFYPQDFLVGTAMLSAEETGAYIRLLCYQWTNDGLPNDQVILARIAGCGGNAIASIWHKFGICDDGMIRNKRLDEIKNAQTEFRAKQKQNAEKRWKSGENHKKAMPPHDSGIPSGICQTDALHSSIFNTNIANAILSNSDAEKIDEVEKPKRKREQKQVDAEWIADLKRHYPDINLDSELGKMQAWCENNKRDLTRKFIIGWLNRVVPVKLPKSEVKNEWEW